MKIRKAFVMSVHAGAEQEYEKRHDPIWPELERDLKDHGVSNYSIFLQPATRQLFGYVEIESEEQWVSIASTGSAENGGSTWATSCRRTRTTVRPAPRYGKFFIWNDRNRVAPAVFHHQMTAGHIPWDGEAAAHLLRRAGFGDRPEDAEIWKPRDWMVRWTACGRFLGRERN